MHKKRCLRYEYSSVQCKIAIYRGALTPRPTPCYHNQGAKSKKHVYKPDNLLRKQPAWLMVTAEVPVICFVTNHGHSHLKVFGINSLTTYCDEFLQIYVCNPTSWYRLNICMSCEVNLWHFYICLYNLAR